MTALTADRSGRVMASSFSIVLGLSALGQSWKVAGRLWGISSLIGTGILIAAGIVWAILIAMYLCRIVFVAAGMRAELAHPVQGSGVALISIATLLIGIALLPYSPRGGAALIGLGIAWHLTLALWHAGEGWRGDRSPDALAPNIYLPTVAGNFVSGAALGALGHPDWGWLFFGAGLFSWLALESLVLGRLWRSELPTALRPLAGVQFAPPAVAASSWLLLDPAVTSPPLLMLFGYGLFQLLLGLRLWRWLGHAPFGPSYWAYTFGAGSSVLVCLKLAVLGVSAARDLSAVVLTGYSLFVACLVVGTVLPMLGVRRS